MEEFLLNMGTNSVFMFISIIAFVVLLIILLVVIVSRLNVKTYKDKSWNTEIDNKDKKEYISLLEKELEEYKIKNAENLNELKGFNGTKKKLEITEERLTTLQDRHNNLEKNLVEVKTKFKNSEELYERLYDDYVALKQSNENTLELHNKCRINNSRLLIKLESEERNISSQQEVMLENRKEIKVEFELLLKKLFGEESQKLHIEDISKEFPIQMQEFKNKIHTKDNLAIEYMAQSLYKTFENSFKDITYSIENIKAAEDIFYSIRDKLTDSRGSLVKQIEQLQEHGSSKK